jgi:hypothetical protein
MKKTAKAFRLPPLGMMPRNGDLRDYGFNYDPLADRHNLEYIGKLPAIDNRKVKNSIVGIGYETLCRDTFDPKLTYEKMANTGVKWARLQSGWLKCEKEKSVYDFAWLDETVDNLLAIGINPWISVSFGNPLHTPVEGYETYAEDHPGEMVPSFVRGYVGEVPTYHGEEAVAAWKNYLKAMTEHFKGRVTHWEIWNEPNTAPFGFWKTYGLHEDLDRSAFEAECAKDYVELVRISSEAIRSVDPKAQIIGGAISLTLDACFYVRNLAKNGIAKYIDIFSFHPYGPNPEFALAERYDNIRHELDTHGGKHVRIWQGECGFPTESRPGFGNGDRYAQSKFLTRRFTADFIIGCEMSSFFMVIDKQGYEREKGKVCGQGVLDCTGAPKQSYHALQAMGFMFADAGKADDLYIRVNNFGTPLLSNLRNISIVTNRLKRGNVPVFSYHIPENPNINVEPGMIDIQLWTDETYKFDDLVLIDPIRGNVYRITEFESVKRGFKYPWLGFDEVVDGFTTLTKMPVVDYPLFITDSSIIG